MQVPLIFPRQPVPEPAQGMPHGLRFRLSGVVFLSLRDAGVQ